MKTRIFAARFFAPFWLFLALFTAPLQTNAAQFVPEQNEFISAVVMVPKTHEILYAYEPDRPHPAASLTKLINTLVFVRTKPNWNKIVALSAKDEVGGGRLRVRSGARLSLRDALYSTITPSANNTAVSLLRLSGKRPATYLKEMNQLATSLGATHSHFIDPSGMGVGNTTTARDMALIAEAAFRDPMIRAAASTSTYHFVIRNTGEQKTIRNTNALLTEDPTVEIIGGKTGYLEESLYNLVVQLRPRSPDGESDSSRELIVVVLGAPTKAAQFTSVKHLAEWAWQSYEFPRTSRLP
jgi:D-alanyl-D-alanine carboxypeptidase